MDWHLLIYQIPAKPSYFRAKIWRRLQKIGAVAVKQAVYVMPSSETFYEDLGWIAKEITESGGDAVLIQATFLEGLNDEQIIDLFQKARQVDYEKLGEEVRALAEKWQNSTGSDVAVLDCNSSLRRLRKSFSDIQAIDFFPGTGQAHLEASLTELESNLRTPNRNEQETSEDIEALKGKTWVTRSNIYVDRMASAWFVRRFIDRSASLKFVKDNRYQPDEDEVRYDMMEAEYTHRNEFCTFEVLARTFAEGDLAIEHIAKIIHDIDINDDTFGLEETPGVKALFDGIVATVASDEKRVERASSMLNELYAYCNNLE